MYLLYEEWQEPRPTDWAHGWEAPVLNTGPSAHSGASEPPWVTHPCDVQGQQASGHLRGPGGCGHFSDWCVLSACRVAECGLGMRGPQAGALNSGAREQLPELTLLYWGFPLGVISSAASPSGPWAGKEALGDVPSGRLRRTRAWDLCRQLWALWLQLVQQQPGLPSCGPMAPPFQGFVGLVVFTRRWSIWAFLTLSPPDPAPLPGEGQRHRCPGPQPSRVGRLCLAVEPSFPGSGTRPSVLCSFPPWCLFRGGRHEPPLAVASVSSSVSWQTVVCEPFGFFPGFTLLARPFRVVQPGSLVTEASASSRGRGLCGLLLI